MKFDKFTLKVQEALATAQQVAMAKSHIVLSPLHLLSAVCDDDAGIVVLALKEIGANLEKPFLNIQTIPFTGLPFLRITDKGLADIKQKKLVSLFVE